VTAEPNRPIDAALAGRLYRQAKARRWGLEPAVFTAALETSCAKAFPDGDPDERELAAYLDTLHLEDLALACACAEGIEAAWDHFVVTMRPALYRAADALDPSGGAREPADSLYAELLYGLDERGKRKQSLLRYFHGRSSLATWLRAVLSQRYVDRLRVIRRIEPLPSDIVNSTPFEPADSECPKYVEFLSAALEHALAKLEPRDRLRLGLYYAQQLTLAETGKLMKEHEATVSRNLARTRAFVREEVEKKLRAGGLTSEELSRCFECASRNAGPMDLDEMLAPRKEFAQDRSI
jgi:RNA polymerase sigma factor (sigma-70 family)